MKKITDETSLMEIFSQRLNDLLIEQEKTGKWLSDVTGISVGQISNYRNGEKSVPSALKVRIIAEALNVSCDYLLGLTDSQKDIDDPQRYVVDYTGLSDQAVFHLHKATGSSFIANEFELSFLTYLITYRKIFSFGPIKVYDYSLEHSIEMQSSLLDRIKQTKPTVDELFDNSFFADYEKCEEQYRHQRFRRFEAIEYLKDVLSSFFEDKTKENDSFQKQLEDLFYKQQLDEFFTSSLSK